MIIDGELDRGSNRRRRVLIAYKYIPQYRQVFFEGLRDRLAEKRIELDLVYGDPVEGESEKLDAVYINWATHMPNRMIRVLGKNFIYQPIMKLARSYDLVIVEQANRLLVNPILLCMNKLRLTRVAYWGHGKDFQGGDSLVERLFKRVLIPHAHWWFAYNEVSASVVREAGYPDERITRVMNTIDSERLKKALSEVSLQEVEECRRRIGLTGNNVCIYIGGMYANKRIPFLLEACERARERIPDFEIVFLGGGVDRPLADAFAAKHDWAVSCGPVFGREKAIYMKLAKLLLMPGLVGLAIIDAFAAEIPIVTTNVPYHSPEIEYLNSGKNGEMIFGAGDVEQYADRIVSLLRDESYLGHLRAGCRQAAETYTMEAMVNRFADGVMAALDGDGALT